jgi:hypothetical protein
MIEKPSSIRNLGPATDAVYAKAGIFTADEIRDLGPDAAYLKILETGSRPHFIAYYALVMGLQGRPWNDCKGDEKDALKIRFEAIKKRHKTAPKSMTAIDEELAKLGVIKPS